MSEDVAKIHTKVGVVILWVITHLLDQIPEMLMRVFKLVNELNPADRMLSSIEHARSPVA